MKGNPAKKRNHNDGEEDASKDPLHVPKTPTVSPTNAFQGAGLSMSMPQLGYNQMDLETQMEGKLQDVPKAQPTDPPSPEGQNKRARLLPSNATLVESTHPSGPSAPATGAEGPDPASQAAEVPRSRVTTWHPELRRLDGNNASDAHSSPSPPSSLGAPSRGSEDPHQASASSDAPDPGEKMEVD